MYGRMGRAEDPSLNMGYLPANLRRGVLRFEIRINVYAHLDGESVELTERLLLLRPQWDSFKRQLDHNRFHQRRRARDYH